MRRIYLAYHRVGNSRDNLMNSKLSIFTHVLILKLFGYRCLNTYPHAKKGFEITFDDGWADNTSAIFMLNEKLDTKPTIFLISGYLGKSEFPINMDQNRKGRFFSVSEILGLLGSNYIDVGAHSHTHPEFRKISEIQQVKEVEDCVQYLEEQLGRKIYKFCFPKGSWTHYSLRMLTSKKLYFYISVSKSNELPPDRSKFLRLRLPLYRKDGLMRFALKILRNNIRLRNDQI
jgi:peptidoglycan/xylan/chitin deacetylase (PgdA/CDA1 family)